MARILIADDEPILRMDLAGMLTDLGYEVIGEACDGFDAVELCRAQHPDLVLMDVKMPVFDGLTASETILSENLAKSVVLLTAYNDAEIIERAKNAGVTGYLVKPIEQRLLRPTIEVALSQSERLMESRMETAQAKRQLSESKLIQQAQGILAKRENISESDAYKLMRKLSMDKRTSMAVLSQAIIDQSRRAAEADSSADAKRTNRKREAEK